MNKSEFRRHFQALTGNEPLSWQWRLFREFAEGRLPRVMDLPTGLGKTMVIVIWLIAREINKSLPRRLIYVVDRRTVVDQATDLAKSLVVRWKETELCTGDPPVLSTLRGQLADNREWSRDPSRSAIIIGTVDLIGSALLFSGYRSSFKRRPLEAGLLGQDSLLVLDEAHLSKPFEKLISSIEIEGEFQKDHAGHVQGTPMKVIRMSATSSNIANSAPPFALQFDDEGNLTGEDGTDAIISERFEATKRLAMEMLSERDNANRRLADAALELAQNNAAIGKRIVVFVRSPADAREIGEMLRDYERPAKSKANPDPLGPYTKSVDVLTGTLRGRERDKLVAKDVFEKRWLNGSLMPGDPENQGPVFLVATSAGEVGFDLNADHLVGDGSVPLDSWIQRLGRVNRRGKGGALIQVIVQPSGKQPENGNEHTIASAAALTIEALQQLPHAQSLAADVRPGPVFDASPRALHRLAKPDNAMSPVPSMVDLTEVLLDKWSMTSISAPMPGRPEVAPWLRGIADDVSQTTIVWRAELELLNEFPNGEKAIRSILAKHPIRPHESLTVSSHSVLGFLKEVTKKHRRPDLLDARIAVKRSRDLNLITVRDLIADPAPLFADPTLILPASFGGLDESGMLSLSAIPPSPKQDDGSYPSLDVADEPGYEPFVDVRDRQRILIERTAEGWKMLPLPGGVELPADLDPDRAFGTRKALFNALSAARFRVRLVEALALNEESEEVKAIVMLAPALVRDRSDGKDGIEPLTSHVARVEREAERIARELRLKDPILSALFLAARWHDEGKKAGIWQRFVYGTDPNDPVGKADVTRGPKSLKGYRHEFGSLLRLKNPKQHGTEFTCPLDLEICDLALHLIATHHGSARPHFENPFDREFASEQCDATHLDLLQRFGRLQQRYGWWHLAWLENLLRCADALGSADLEAEDDPDGSTDESGVAR